MTLPQRPAPASPASAPPLPPTPPLDTQLGPTPATALPASTGSPPGTEFIIGVALLTALVALAIDTMLPAMGRIAADLGAGGGNRQQWILITVFLGLAAGQLVFGPLSDQTGRKPAILLGLGLYALGSAVCGLATDFSMLLAGRVLQGFGAAGPRVVAMAMVRDGQSGSAMARVMSLITMVFIAVPIVAPSLGQLLLLATGWRGIFGLLFAAALVAAAWLLWRQPETLPPAARVPMRPVALAEATARVLGHPVSLRYALMMALMFGAMVAYLGTSQQVIGVQYGAGPRFGLYFAVLAVGVGLAAGLNARWVHRLGVRRLTRRALAGFNAVAWVMLLACAASGGQPPLAVFLALMAALLFCLGFLFGNAQALAMAPLGQQAGLAASVIGTVSTLGSIIVGGVIGHLYDGTLWPLAGGFVVVGALGGGLMRAATRHEAATAGPH